MKSVVLCGSTRFKSEMRVFGADLKKLGVTVLEPYLYSPSEEEWNALSDEHRRYIELGLTHDHFYKVNIADVVFIYNQGGYCGNSTTLEIGCAVAMAKPIYALSDDTEELSRSVLFRAITKTPEELLQYL